MKKALLASVAALALMATTPVLAQHHGNPTGQSGGQGGGAHGGNTGGGSHHGHGGQGSGGQGSGGHGGGNQGGGNPFHGGTGGNRGGHGDHRNPFDIFGTGGHGYHGNNYGHRGHNNAFDQFRRAFNAPHHYRHGSYHRPPGWYYRRWTFGDFLPALFFGRDYWIDDYQDFDLPYPPPGCVWVRYGNDALLVDEDTGEVVQVVYGIFY